MYLKSYKSFHVSNIYWSFNNIRELQLNHIFIIIVFVYRRNFVPDIILMMRIDLYFYDNIIVM